MAVGVRSVVYGRMPDAEELAGRVPAVPPRITAWGVIASDRDRRIGTAAALLAWGRSVEGWSAGICFPLSMSRGTPFSALLTLWLPATSVSKRAGETYAAVPRVLLSGPPQGWPALPPRYPKLDAEWLALHFHVPVADPEGEYRDYRDDIRGRWARH